jgi:outer membrane protein OmpA-like peptidoglycan-associated protein
MLTPRFKTLATLVASVLAIAALSGCATKKFVRQEVAGARGYTDTQVTAVRTDLDQVRTQTDAAMQRAQLAERLASGDIEYTEVATNQVMFEFDDWRLSPEAQSTLDQMAGQLGTHKGYIIEIRGYADARGTDRYNYRLGRERADEVFRYLMTRHSVPSTRVATMSFGEESPLADNETSEGRSQNRRVQVRLLDIKSSDTPVSVVPQP